MDIDNDNDDGHEDDEGAEDEIVQSSSTVSVECVGFAQGSYLKYIASGCLDKTLKIWDGKHQQ
jgi:hypothetical protein